MPEEDPGVRIGRLRWPVVLASRVQTPNTAQGITETLVGPVTVHSDVQAVGGLTFWGAEQTDTPITHRIFMRWHDYLDQTFAILRSTLRPDGSARTETFRVRRIKELGGRKRFVLIEAELEKYQGGVVPVLIVGGIQTAAVAGQSYAATITGNGVVSTFTITHGLGTVDVIVQVRDPADENARIPMADDLAPTPNTVTIPLSSPLAAGAELRVLVLPVR